VSRADPTWLAGPVLEVAPRLLGAHLTTVLPDGVVTVRLTEVEAYDGANDPGSHAYRGRTARNAVMFGSAGYLYVYRHLGLHVCANVVTGADGSASAVLLRAGEVVEGADLARERRRRRGVVRTDVDLARGPARLADALGIDLGMYGVDLLGEAGLVRLTPPAGATPCVTGPRVGVSGAGGDAVVHPWRFWIPGDPTVSAYRAAARRPRRARQTRPGPD
jgi:DNA-3-methyladenine glycosylase